MSSSIGENRKQIVLDLLVVFFIFFVTDFLSFNIFPQLYYPSLILWTLMPLLTELAIRKGSMRNLGFQRTNYRRDISVYFLVMVAWLLLFSAAFQTVVRNSVPSPLIYLYLASVFFHPALVEELNFRGFLQTRLEHLTSPRMSLVVQAAIFGLYHVPPTIAASSGAFTFGGPLYPFLAFLFGIVLGLIYVRTRNLIVGMSIHASGLEIFLLIGLLASH